MPKVKEGAWPVGEWFLNALFRLKLLSPLHDYRMVDRTSDPRNAKYDFVLYRCYRHPNDNADFVIVPERLLSV